MSDQVTVAQLIVHLSSFRKGAKLDAIRNAASVNEVLEILDAQGWHLTREIAIEFVRSGGTASPRKATPVATTDDAWRDEMAQVQKNVDACLSRLHKQVSEIESKVEALGKRSTTTARRASSGSGSQ